MTTQRKSVTFDPSIAFSIETSSSSLHNNNAIPTNQSCDSSASSFGSSKGISSVASSSYERRRSHRHSLLLPITEIDLNSPAQKEENKSENERGIFKKIQAKLFRNKQYSIRKQLMLTFGTVNAITILLLVAICIGMLHLTGNALKWVTNESFDVLSKELQGRATRYLAEDLAFKLVPEDVVQLIYEATQDRFMGYPDAPGYDNDKLVPFPGVNSKSNLYPILGDPVPLDWEIQPNVNETNYEEHIGSNRWRWYENINSSISTATASYYMQGICNPSVMDKNSSTYFPYCTKHNNNKGTGGVIAPSSTNYQIHRKVSDLTPLFKALYEYHTEIRSLGLHFANGGSGATYQFPHFQLDTKKHYTSSGCEWLLDTPHPLGLSRMIVEDEASKNRIEDAFICRPNGKEISSRLYNPLEREWCRDQATHPNRIRVSGPYLDAFHENTMLITVGRAIYDKVTSELIACIAVDFIFDSIDELLAESRLTNSAQISIVRYDDVGTLVASSEWNLSSERKTNKTKTIDEIPDAGVSKEAFQSILMLIDYDDYKKGNKVWNSNEVRNIYERHVYHDIEGDYYVTGYPMPVPPDAYDDEYTPEYIALVSVYKPSSKEFQAVKTVMDLVDKERLDIVIISVIAGLVGLVILLCNIIFVSQILTSPLQYMNDAAFAIIEKHVGTNDYDYEGFDANQNLLSSSEYMNQLGNKCGKTFDSINSSKERSSLFKMQWSSNKNVGVEKKLSTKSINYSFRPYKPLKFVPETEIDKVVEQFVKMISQFTSSSFAKSDQVKIKEFRNEFALEDSFEKLYLSRYQRPSASTDKNQQPFKYNYHKDDKASKSLRHRYHGKNVKVDNNHNGKKNKDKNKSIVEKGAQVTENTKKRRFSGSLFFWIMFLTVVPFIIVTVTFSGIIVEESVSDLVAIHKRTRSTFLHVEKVALEVYVGHRSHLSASLMEKPLRDLHVLMRYAGWLLLDGISRPQDSIRQLLSPSEECKIYPHPFQCSASRQASQRCDCSWNDINPDTCSNFTSSSNSRYLQIPGFIAQSQDVWSNGDRNTTSYPNISYSPNTTAWFSNIQSLPGFESGSVASGYETTYDRIAIMSANPMHVPLYNKNNGGERSHLASYISFEADGSLMGYAGCGAFGSEAFFQIENNSAFSQQICPSGKYGYDPRCREWYQYGKDLYEKSNAHLYVTPPYLFAGGTYAQSCTAPLIDQIKGRYIGQVLIDFKITPLLAAFKNDTTPLRSGGFPVLIATDKFYAADTVVGPGFEFSKPTSIADLVYANDPNCNISEFEENINDRTCHRESFQKIVNKMKAGDNATEEFTVMTNLGKEEKFVLAYSPVKVKSFFPIDNSDFSRGVDSSEYLIYSAALAESEGSWLNVYKKIEREINVRGAIPFIVIVVVVFFASFCYIYISLRVARSIIEPMHYLLDMIRKINGLECYGNAAEIDMEKHSHSLEVANVSNTIESLYNVISSANLAFFAGDLGEAYSVLTDVLNVYIRLDNRKGIGIASNNLGNTMLAMFRAMKRTGENYICGFSKEQIIAKGTGYFHEAIGLGEKAYDDFYNAQGWSPVCLEFMQHLSNRYFNRGMFLLTIREDHTNPQEIEELGLKDLEIARDMDVEIVDQGKEAGWGVRTLDRQFEVILSRARGHLALLEMGYPDLWEIEESLDEGFEIITTEILQVKKKPKPTSSLFLDLTPVGRMQQIETEIMRYKIVKDEINIAAKIAIRMLIEDEYTLVDAHLNAVEALLKYVESPAGKQDGYEPQKERKSAIMDYQQSAMQFAQVKPMFITRDSRLRSFVYEESSELGLKLENDQCDANPPAFLFKETSRGDVTMEVF